MTQCPTQRKRSNDCNSNNSVSGIVLTTEPRLTPEFCFHYLGPLPPCLVFPALTFLSSTFLLLFKPRRALFQPLLRVRSLIGQHGNVAAGNVHRCKACNSFQLNLLTSNLTWWSLTALQSQLNEHKLSVQH